VALLVWQSVRQHQSGDGIENGSRLTHGAGYFSVAAPGDQPTKEAK
jgi:hypothetical protein